mmetsp:Transcript_5984/g.16794  ORF Transcript_5984/g.16794 Transcript_5984/m.16794 type:complete len:100 (-) Transcript_5984:58-357(-)
MPCGADVWSFGVLTIEALCGLDSFEQMLGRSDSQEGNTPSGADLDAVLGNSDNLVLALQSRLDRVDDALVTLLQGALKVDPKSRLDSERVLRSSWLCGA